MVENNGLFTEETSKTSLRDLVASYIAYWPLFLICVGICVGTGMLYLRYAVPKYVASTSILVKGSESGSSNSEDILEQALNGKPQINLNNEILLLNSVELMHRIVNKNNFNISYFIKGRLLNTDIYKGAPFKLVPQQITDSSSTYDFRITKFNAIGGEFSLGLEKKAVSYKFFWNQPFVVSGQTFVLISKGVKGSGNGEYIVRWQPVSVTAGELAQKITVRPFDSRTTVIQLSIKIENLKRGEDILNALFKEFNLADIEERNKLSASTVEFIDDRLLRISGELKGVEGNLENYQGNNRLVDIKGQSMQSLENSDVVSKTIKDLAIQQGVVNMILDYFENPVNGNKLVPSALGLNDGTLSLLITQYNELQLKREREAPSLAPNSTVMQDLNRQLSNLKSSILENLTNIRKNLKLQESAFQQQNRQYRNFLSAIPHNERVLQEIKRKQSITEGLYLYLLQKREEAAISSTSSNIAHYKQIDAASGYGPVEPNRRNIIITTVLLGIFLGFGLIYFKNLLNNKIRSEEDLRNISLPVLGHISHVSGRKKELISVTGRNLTAEEFRSLRTNLSYIMRNKGEKIVLVTSSLSNEGKSFISLNLAAVLAVTGKRVALLEFDIRNPSLATKLDLDNSKGLTDFLSGKSHLLSEISYSLDEIPTLDVFPSGHVDINPADVLLSENIELLFSGLKENYDYVIVDSPPVTVVSDGFILAQYSQLVLFVIRQGHTLKKQVEFIRDAVSNKRLKNLHLVLNDKEVNNKKANGTYYHYGTTEGPEHKKFKALA